MTYVLERDGLAACPDDPLRIAPPQDCGEVTESQIDGLAAQYEHEALKALTGSWPFAQIGNTRMQAGELFEAITETEDYETLYPLLVGSKSTAEKLIRNWAYRTAEQNLTRGIQ